MPALGHSTTDMFQSEVLIDANVPRPEQQTTNAGDDDGDCDVDLWTDIFLEDQQKFSHNMMLALATGRKPWKTTRKHMQMNTGHLRYHLDT